MNILYIISDFNIYGGVPRKLLELFKINNDNFYLYVWSNNYIEHKEKFDVYVKVFVGPYKRNIYKHIRDIIEIIDKYNIQIIYVYFTFGEILGAIIKLIRPNIKVIISFVSSLSPSFVKRLILKHIYRYIKIDAFLYISNYVKREKLSLFPILSKKDNYVIWNGALQRPANINNNVKINHFSLLAISGLVRVKNLCVIIECVYILIKEFMIDDIYLYIAGDGPLREELQNYIKNKNVERNVFILGYIEDIGNYLDQCDVFIHPSLCEGFGISVVEAMLAGKPILVSKSGALPEIIIENESGLVIDPYDPRAWAEAVLFIKNNPEIAKYLAENAQKRALEYFTIEKMAENYSILNRKILSKNLS